jgi:hypothetical protein
VGEAPYQCGLPDPYVLQLGCAGALLEGLREELLRDLQVGAVLVQSWGVSNPTVAVGAVESLVLCL